MPTVLITGLNGFVAVHTAVVYLQNGWNVRGTVRSEEKGEKVLALPCFEKYEGKIEYVLLEDLIKGDYTDALKGVDAVGHYIWEICL
jgi:nucleoside-diphosphate-sugar epimerase